MLPIEKNKDIIDQISRVIRRSNNIHEVRDKLFHFLQQIMSLNNTFAQKINLDMTKFQQFVMKISLYYQKSNHIINLSKLYRQFSLQIQRNAKLNLISLSKIKLEGIQKQEEKLAHKCNACISQFQSYTLQEKEYNKKYVKYSGHCGELAMTINRYKSYQNPVSFYSKILINEDQSELQKKHQECSTNETDIITNRQMLDEQRGFITQNIKEVNQNYFVLIHNYLVNIETLIKCIVYPKNQERLDRTELNLRSVDNIQEQHMAELQRLDNLYATEANQKHSEQGNPLEEFSQLFRKSINQFEINSDYRFFHDRCDSIRNKKLKTSEETFKIQSLLVDQLKQQLTSYEHYQAEYKRIEKGNFTNNGIDVYKKRFRKYFGSNFTQICELCLNLIERQKKSLEKICKNMIQGQVKMRRVLESKKQAINGFENRTKIILQDHRKLKQKVIKGTAVDSEQLASFKSSISNSFNQLKKQFHDLQRNQTEQDKRFFGSLKSLYETIMKEATSKNLNKMLEKQKNRINILNGMNINHQILLILKEDSRYQNLLNECPKPNLYSTFATLIPKKEIDQTKRILQLKDQRLRSMVRPKQGCCGLRSQIVKPNILAHHDCGLKTQKDKFKGTLNICSNGLIFQENTWFVEGLQLILPQNDIKYFDLKTVEEKEYVGIETEFGYLYFEGESNKEVIESIQTHLTFIGGREPSQPGNKRNQSSGSGIFKNNTSTDFKMSYDKSMNSNGLSRVLDSASPLIDHMPPKKDSKPRSFESQLRDLIRKWKQAQFFPEENFKRVVTKGDKRRDYEYQSGHSKFYLREMKEYRLVERDLIFKYKWKVSFPQSQMLHSFRHEQQVRIQSVTKEMRIRIVAAKYSQQQLFIKNKFYKEVQEMNKLLCQFIVYILEKEADVINEQQFDEHKSLESYNVVLDDINLEERQSKFERTESLLRNSKIEKRTSLNNQNNSMRTNQ